MEREVVNPWTWQDAFGFVQGNKVGGADRFLFARDRPRSTPKAGPSTRET